MQSHPFPILPCEEIDAAQLSWQETTGPITPFTPVHQVFRASRPRLHRIEVYIETHARTNHCQLWLSLHEGEIGPHAPDRAPVRLVGPLDAAELADPGWFAFEFDPLPASVGRTYTAVFTSPDATLGHAVALRATAGAPRVLLFRTVCLMAPAPFENFRRFRRSLAQFDPTVTHHPLMARLEVSRPCDLHCVMCLRGLNPFDPTSGGTAFLSLDTFRALDPILGDLLWVIGFGLGEPLLNPHLLPILRHLRNRNDWADVFVSTNGTHLHAPVIEALVGEKLLSTCQVSIDGATAQTYEAVRRGGRHAEVLRNLRALVAERERRQATHLTLKTEMLVMQPTKDEVFSFIRQMADLGVDRIVLDSPKGADFRALRVDDDDGMARICEQVERGHELLAGTKSCLDGPLLWELARWHRSSGRTGAPPPSCTPDSYASRTRQAQPPRSPCALPWESCYLEADGTLRVCYNSARLLDHARSGNLQPAWTSGRGYQQLRAELTDGCFHEHCAHCLKTTLTRVENLRTPPTYLDACCTDSGHGAPSLRNSPGIRFKEFTPAVPVVLTKADAIIPTPIASDSRTGLHGYVDEAAHWGDTLALRGWARDALHHSPADRVELTIDGRPAQVMSPWTERPDVVAAWDGDAALYGFTLQVPTSALSGPGPWRIAVLAIRDRQVSAELAWHAGVTMALPRLSAPAAPDLPGFHLTPHLAWAELASSQAIHPPLSSRPSWHPALARLRRAFR